MNLIVTSPALAVKLGFVNISMPLGLAAMVRTVEPPVLGDELGEEEDELGEEEAAGEDVAEEALDAVDVDGELEAEGLDELLLEPPQAAIPSAIAAALRRAMGNLGITKTLLCCQLGRRRDQPHGVDRRVTGSRRHSALFSFPALTARPGTRAR